ncbi:hypothetical protein ACFRCQ_28100 [Cytobacillus firmus]
MYNFIKRMYETKREDGTYIYDDAAIDTLVEKGFITAEQSIEIKRFEQV